MSLIQDIPDSGRYDLILTDIGTNDKHQKVARFVIDGGDFSGKLVSTLNVGTILGCTEDELEQLRWEFRCSAHVEVIRLAKVRGSWRAYEDEIPDDTEAVQFKYKIDQFEEPTNEQPTVSRRRTRSRFIRNR